jgi:hypothetical protein
VQLSGSNPVVLALTATSVAPLDNERQSLAALLCPGVRLDMQGGLKGAVEDECKTDPQWRKTVSVRDSLGKFARDDECLGNGRQSLAESYDRDRSRREEGSSLGGSFCGESLADRGLWGEARV